VVAETAAANGDGWVTRAASGAGRRSAEVKERVLDVMRAGSVGLGVDVPGTGALFPGINCRGARLVAGLACHPGSTKMPSGPRLPCPFAFFHRHR
jgi:hypothetical protein